MVRITGFGTPTVYLNDRPVTSLSTRTRNLAVLFATAVEGQIPRERLASLLWGDREPRKARQSLSEALYELKKELGEWCSASLNSVAIAPELQVDVAEFYAALEAGDDDRVLRLYGGHFLDDFYTGSNDFDAWTEHRRRSLFSEYRSVATRVIRDALDEADYRMSLLRARDWVDVEPLDDEAQHYLIASLALSGDRAGALAQFDTYSSALQAEELTPLDRTLALRAAVADGIVERVATLADLSPAEQGDATSRGTSLWWPNKGVGPRLLLIDRPDASDGAVVWLRGPESAIGPSESDIPVPGGEDHPPVQIQRIGEGRSARFVLRTEPDGPEVFLLLRGPRPLRTGDVVRAGEQRFVVEGDR